MLDTSRVLLFIKSVDALLDTYEGLTIDWVVVKWVCSRFDKQRKWNVPKSLSTNAETERKLEEPIPVRTEETRRWLKSGTVPTDVVKGPSEGVPLDELTKMVRNI